MPFNTSVLIWRIGFLTYLGDDLLDELGKLWVDEVGDDTHALLLSSRYGLVDVAGH